MPLLSYEDQIYLMGYWIRTNVTEMDQIEDYRVSAKRVLEIVKDNLEAEFSVADEKVIAEVAQGFFDYEEYLDDNFKSNIAL